VRQTDRVTDRQTDTLLGAMWRNGALLCGMGKATQSFHFSTNNIATTFKTIIITITSGQSNLTKDRTAEGQFRRIR